jgi:acyl carrier protein
MDDTTVRQALRTLITRDFMRDPTSPLADDEAIISTGLMDSFALAELGVFVEQQFNVYIPDPDLTVAKMDTLDLMVARVLRG